MHLQPTSPGVALTDQVSEMLARNAVVAIGVSGGKDSDACAIATSEYLDAIGHTGPRLLVHSDLGMVEWKQSAIKCEELAAALGMELVTVRRAAGGLMERWESRWASNVRRYSEMDCVKVILPWSTPALRFCTSELKSTVIASYLKKRFRGQEIINVTGIRRQESASRRKAEVSKVDPRLSLKGLNGVTWNSVIEWTIEEVKAAIARRGLVLHEAYTRWGVSRVSCVMCVMSSSADLRASAACPDNQDVYRRMVSLEADSTFAFQSNNWLGDVATHLLGDELLERLFAAKEAARRREIAEARIPSGLEYQKGWPTRRPTYSEAQIIAEVRLEVADALHLGSINYTSAASVLERYDELLAAKLEKTPAQVIQLPGQPQLEQLQLGW